MQVQDIVVWVDQLHDSSSLPSPGPVLAAVLSDLASENSYFPKSGLFIVFC